MLEIKIDEKEVKDWIFFYPFFYYYNIDDG